MRFVLRRFSLHGCIEGPVWLTQRFIDTVQTCQPSALQVFLSEITAMKRNHWHPLQGHPELHCGQYVVPNFVSNSVAIQVTESQWVLISPGQSLLTPFLNRWGSSDLELSILFPNAYHHLGVPAWLRAFPGAKLYASRKAAARLMKQGFETVRPLEEQALRLPPAYDLLFPPGHRGGDVWVRKRSGTDTLWITCDSFLNYERMSNQWLARFLQRALGAAPGLKLSQVIKWLLLDDRQAFKLWALDQLAQDPPTILIPSHGEVLIDRELTALLQELIQTRL